MPFLFTLKYKNKHSERQTMARQTSVTGNLDLGVDPATGAITAKPKRSLTSKALVQCLTDETGSVTGLLGPDGREFLVISSAPPNNADGRLDGTIYIQTA